MMNMQKELLIQMYKLMKLTRENEQSLELLYKQGRLPGAIYPGIGQEACYAGCVSALESNDVITTTHRDMGALLAKGITSKEIMTQHFAKANSPTKGRGEDNYLGDLSKGVFTSVSMLPDLYPVAVGAAMYFERKNKSNVAMAFCGEGASARGDFHESLNWAAIYNLSVVFIVVNNQFAYSTPNEIEIPATVAQRAAGYGIEGFSVDGNDAMAVYEVAKEAVDKARQKKGPTLIECKTFRIKGHAGHDSAEYVDKNLLEEWKKKDPIDKLENYLLENGLLDQEEKQSIEQQIKDEVDEAINFAQNSPDPDPRDLTMGVYSD